MKWSAGENTKSKKDEGCKDTQCIFSKYMINSMIIGLKRTHFVSPAFYSTRRALEIAGKEGDPAGRGSL